MEYPHATGARRPRRDRLRDRHHRVLRDGTAPADRPRPGPDDPADRLADLAVRAGRGDRGAAADRRRHQAAAQDGADRPGRAVHPRQPAVRRRPELRLPRGGPADHRPAARRVLRRRSGRRRRTGRPAPAGPRRLGDVLRPDGGQHPRRARRDPARPAPRLAGRDVRGGRHRPARRRRHRPPRPAAAQPPRRRTARRTRHLPQRTALAGPGHRRARLRRTVRLLHLHHAHPHRGRRVRQGLGHPGARPVRRRHDHRQLDRRLRGRPGPAPVDLRGVPGDGGRARPVRAHRAQPLDGRRDGGADRHGGLRDRPHPADPGDPEGAHRPDPGLRHRAGRLQPGQRDRRLARRPGDRRRVRADLALAGRRGPVAARLRGCRRLLVGGPAHPAGRRGPAGGSAGGPGGGSGGGSGGGAVGGAGGAAAGGRGRLTGRRPSTPGAEDDLMSRSGPSCGRPGHIPEGAPP
ncbi:hypothetical protein HUT16_36115 [Kitasatospora sp. NA04385]|nr:hypothetical protein HUT16_36115 [Kitasatospora sp. NA04385]